MNLRVAWYDAFWHFIPLIISLLLKFVICETVVKNDIDWDEPVKAIPVYVFYFERALFWCVCELKLKTLRVLPF